MTVCEICGGDKFTLQDGFYFCDECQTQSQDIREIVTEDVFSHGIKNVRNAVISEKTRADRRRSKEIQAGMRGVRPRISIVEAVNELLRRWTAALVARGAPAHLPEVVAPLWEASLRTEYDNVSPNWAFGLLWLALAECEPLCLLSDLCRWARQSVLPYYSAVNELPEDVSLNSINITRFRQIEITEMVFLLRKMTRKLRLTPPPSPPMRQLLRRLLDELVLPAQLVDVVTNVARRAPPPYPLLPEAAALALLLVTLKLLFGLDDATEICNSEVAAARNEAEPDGPRWFVFSEWLEFIRQQRSVARENDFQEQESFCQNLQTIGQLDMCRRRHRKLLFDFHRREGTYRCQVERHRTHSAIYRDPEYRQQTKKLFGRPEAPPPPPPSDGDDLLRPVGSRLERQGGDTLRQAEQFRHAWVDFLLDESHVQRLQSKGVPVSVSHTAARQRVLNKHKTVKLVHYHVKGAIPKDLVFVDERSEAIPSETPLPPPRARHPRGDLRLYMPCREVWCLQKLFSRAGCNQLWSEYKLFSAAWPVSFQYLMEMLATSIELTPLEFSTFVYGMERKVLRETDVKWMGRRRRREEAKKDDGTKDKAKDGGRRETTKMDGGRRETAKKDDGRRETAKKDGGCRETAKDDGRRETAKKDSGFRETAKKDDGKRESSGRKTKRRRRESSERKAKRRRRDSSSSMTEVSSEDMKLGSDSKADVFADADMVPSPDMFDEPGSENVQNTRPAVTNPYPTRSHR